MRPAGFRNQDFSFAMTVVGSYRNINSAGKFQRAQSITTGFERQVQHPAGLRSQQLLRDNVWRSLRAAHAEILHRYRSQRGVGSKRDLDKAIEVNFEIDTARFAVQFGTYFAQRAACLFGAATQWAQQLPLQIEQARSS